MKVVASGPPNQQAFVRAVLDRLDVSQTELGRLLEKPNAYGAVHNWLTGRIDLRYDDAIRMLSLCGWLKMDGGRLPRSTDPLQELAASVDALQQGQEAILAALEKLVPAGEAAPAKRRATPKGRRR